MTRLLQYADFTYPRRSTDHCTRVEKAGLGIYAVADRIGSPWSLRFRWITPIHRFDQDLLRHFPAVAGETALDRLEDYLVDKMTEHNVRVRACRTRQDSEAFGYCVCAAAVAGARARLHWLGDCRAYHVRRHAPGGRGPAVFDVKCLTRDHNALGRLMQDRGPVVLSELELAKLDHRLEHYLGHEDLAQVRRVLQAQRVELELGTDEALILCTDGFYQPTQRVLLEANALKMTPAAFLLEEHLARLFSLADEHVPPGRHYWQDLLTYLIDETLHAPGGRRQKDDIAFIGLFRPRD